MTRFVQAARAATLVTALLAGSAAGWAQQSTPAVDPAKLTELENQIRTLTAQTGEQSGQLEALRAQLAERDQKIAGLTADAQAAAERATAAEAAQAQRDQTIAGLTADAKAASERLAAAEAALAERNGVLERQRGELLAARNDLASAEAKLAGKDKEVAALAAAGRELVAAGSEAEKVLAERDAQVADLRTQLLAARNDLGSVEAKLAGKDKEIAALVAAARELVAGGQQLEAENDELASDLAEITGPNEAFMGALAEELGADSGARMVDGRLIFPSDVAFVAGSARLTPQARERALALGKEIAAATTVLPPDEPWVLRIDGHTDRQPVGGRTFTSNRQLAAARALEVVEVLTEAGVPPERLLPAAFGEFRPLDPADTVEAYQANRRIEVQLDDQ